MLILTLQLYFSIFWKYFPKIPNPTIMATYIVFQITDYIEYMLQIGQFKMKTVLYSNTAWFMFILCVLVFKPQTCRSSRLSPKY